MAGGKWYCPTCKQEAELRRLCIVEGCTTIKRRQQMCSFHAGRKDKYGDPLGGPASLRKNLCPNRHLMAPGIRACPVCRERRVQQQRLCGCGAPRAKGRQKCEACLRVAQKRRNLVVACRKYGVSLAEYDALLLHQRGVCAICGVAPRSQRLAIDHNHVTGEVRGLLCKRCNHDLLGGARDSVELLRQAVRYLELPPLEAMRKAS